YIARCYLTADEYLKYVRKSSFNDPDPGGLKHKPHVTIFCWTVGGRNSSRRQVSKEIRIVRLPVSVVALGKVVLGSDLKLSDSKLLTTRLRIGRATSELQSRGHLVCRLPLE